MSEDDKQTTTAVRWDAREITSVVAGVGLVILILGHAFLPSVTVSDKTFWRLGSLVTVLLGLDRFAEMKYGTAKAALSAAVSAFITAWQDGNRGGEK